MSFNILLSFNQVNLPQKDRLANYGQQCGGDMGHLQKHGQYRAHHWYITNIYVTIHYICSHNILGVDNVF